MDQQLSIVKQIRRQRSKPAGIRRDIAILSTLGLLDFIPISLYQLGIIRHLPDVPSRVFDSDYVNASKEAQIAGIPDGPVSLLMYAANLVLISGALRKRKRRNIADLLIAGNAIGLAAGGAYYLFTMATKQRMICLYCVTGALINFAVLAPLYRLFRRRVG